MGNVGYYFMAMRDDTPRLAGKDSGWVNNETRNAPQVQFVLDLPQMGVATVFLEVGEEDSWREAREKPAERGGTPGNAGRKGVW